MPLNLFVKVKLKKLHSAKITNIFTEIGSFSTLHGAINLAQNAPDFPIDPFLKRIAKDSTEMDFNEFSSTPALPLLVENLIQFNTTRRIPLHISEDEISIIPGATYGLHIVLQTAVNEGDEVIIIEPCYDTYLPLVEMRKAKPVFVRITENFEIDWQLLADVISPKTKAIIVNSPHNPTGKIWTKEDWETLWQIIKDHQILVISDEVYDVLVYDDVPFYSAYHHPELKNRCFCLFSMEKMFHLSGWKCSYVLASVTLTNSFQAAHQYICFTTNFYTQYTFGKYLEIFDIEENRLLFENKRDLLLKLMADLPFTISEKACSGYAQTFDFKNINSKISDGDFALQLIEKAKVATIPYSAFYHDGRNSGKLRISFAKRDETLEEAVGNLRGFFSI